MKNKKLNYRSKMVLLSLFTLCMIVSVKAQTEMHSAEIITSVKIREVEVTYLTDQIDGCLLKTTAHSPGLFEKGGLVYIIQDPAGASLLEIYQSGMSEKVYVLATSNEETESDSGDEIASSKEFTSPRSPFPYCNEDTNPIGGGVGYDDIFTATQADIYIEVYNGAVDFKNTIESASPGSVIFIKSDLVIDLSNFNGATGSGSILVPEGVTIASGRGAADPGAMIYTSDFELYYNQSAVSQPVFICDGNDIRFTGLQFQGPVQDEGTNDPKSLIRYKSCIQIAGGYERLEIDNCVFFGWPYTAVRIGGGYDNGSFENNRIHHNYFYNNKQKGLGYGIMVDWGYANIYANVFEANRHDIAGTGKEGSGYEAGCNTVLTGGTSHNFDMHAEGESDDSPNAGRFMYIHHNDFEDIGANRYQENNDHNIYVRGRPDVQCRIENNRFAHSGPQVAIKQANKYLEGYGNMLIWNNIYDHNDYLGWYVQHQWSKNRPNNFMKFISSNDDFMNSSFPVSLVLSYSYNFGDYDGDGSTDVFKLENGELYRLPLDVATHGLSADWEHVLTTSYPMSDLRFGFYDSDNRTDIIHQNGNTINVSWGANSNWTPLLTTGYPLYDLISGDFDGNGIEDLFLANGTSWQVSYNSNSNWTTINSSATSPSNLKLGWFNANNTSDVFLADGTNFMISNDGVSSWATTASSGYLTSDLSIADFNGDNISDVIHPDLREVSIGGNTTWQDCTTNVFPINTFPYGDF